VAVSTRLISKQVQVSFVCVVQLSTFSVHLFWYMIHLSMTYR